MSVTSAMAALIAAMIIGESTTDFNQANTYFGVGDGSATTNQGPPNTNTDLRGANTLRKALTAAPGRSGAALTFVATFAMAEATWVGGWQEWGLFNAPTGGTMLNRKVENLGVKPNTQSWQITATITVSAA